MQVNVDLFALQQLAVTIGAMSKNMLIVGGGIGGLAAALACARGGWHVDVLEQSDAFAEFGAGIQISSNVVRVLQSWGLTDALYQVAARPRQLDVRNASSGKLLAVLPLGATMERRYGAPYLTIARADLQRLLLAAVSARGDVGLHLSSRVVSCVQDEQAVHLQTVNEQTFAAPVLVAADGVWSSLRAQVVPDGAPRVSGHLAFRAMVPQAALPATLRCDQVTVWMGPDYHVVQYPVRGGDWLNVVAIVQGQVYGDPRHWDHSANAADLRSRLRWAAPALKELLNAIDAWRLWPLSDRLPMQSAAQHARGRIALLGDAAHPMRPYLAQGAGMAIEDAAVLVACLHGCLGSAAAGNPQADVRGALQNYAEQRWQRNARVQARAIRNGQIFHLQGPAQLARDFALRLFGARLLDVPWLYKGTQPL